MTTTTKRSSDPRAVPEAERDLLVVYDDAGQAVRARDALLEAGVSGSDLGLDVEPDQLASLRVEMQPELDGAWIVPQARLEHTTEGTRGFMTMGTLGAAVGLLAAFPLALIGTSSTYPMRLLAWALVGIAFGTVVGLVAGPAIVSKGPSAPLVAARGTVLRVNHDSPQLRALLADLGPLRLDEANTDEQPIDTLQSEGPRGLVETVRDMADQAGRDDSDAGHRDA